MPRLPVLIVLTFAFLFSVDMGLAVSCADSTADETYKFRSERVRDFSCEGKYVNFCDDDLAVPIKTSSEMDYFDNYFPNCVGKYGVSSWTGWHNFGSHSGTATWCPCDSDETLERIQKSGTSVRARCMKPKCSSTYWTGWNDFGSHPGTDTVCCPSNEILLDYKTSGTSANLYCCRFFS